MKKGIRGGFTFHAPETVEEAVKLLTEYGSDAKLFAGGTDFLPRYKGGVINPDHVISVKSIKGLDYLKYDKNDGLSIGAAKALREIENDEIVKTVYPVLYEGIHSMASTQIRNAGTVAGNICNAIPSADTAPALLVLNASVKMIGPDGERSVPINEFFKGVCKTVVGQNEIVTAINVPAPAENAYTHYIKSTVRKGLDLAMVGVALYIIAENGVCKEARIALGAVAPTPVRALNAEKYLSGKTLTDEIILEAAKIAAEEDCAPITDIRATEGYRRELVRLSVRDGLTEALNGR